MLFNSMKMLGETQSLKAAVVQIKKTKVTHSGNLQKFAKCIEIITNRTMARAKQVAQTLDLVKNFKACRDGARHGASTNCETKLIDFANEVCDEVHPWHLESDGIWERYTD